MRKMTDHVGRTIEIAISPKRIISLCPAITTTLFSIGLDKEIIGRTRYCLFPENKVEQLEVVGGTKDINLEKIRTLNPDLIIAEKEENTEEIVLQLEKEFPVYVFEVQSIEDNDRMIQDLGQLTNKETASARLREQILQALGSLPNLQGKKVAYMIWQNPFMVVGDDTYINALLGAMNLVNPFTAVEGRYPVVTLEDLQQMDLDYLLLATEPFRFKERHVEKMASLLTTVQVSLIDGEMFWYGVNMIDGANYLKNYDWPSSDAIV